MNQEEIRQVTTHDEKWVPTKERVKISTTNVRLETTVPRRRNEKCLVDAEVFRKILDICPRVQGVDFTEVLDDETTLTFLFDLGYKGPLHKHPVCEVILSRRDINQKFLRSLSQEWTQIFCVEATLSFVRLWTLSLDDLFNNLKVMNQRGVLIAQQLLNILVDADDFIPSLLANQMDLTSTKFGCYTGSLCFPLLDAIFLLSSSKLSYYYYGIHTEFSNLTACAIQSSSQVIMQGPVHLLSF
ncbi:hypothetical protein Tco_0893601 [Tanacetum coccineum]|uniref:Uncharacterized protein n=1 Tax=Tanacetum coccineum TaxID=301880 RepID=A0ABQ5CFL4_9ASTR